MEGILLRLLNMSIQASILIVIVVILRLILKKSPKWIHCLLWVLVAIRLVCPFSIESAFSLAPNAEVISTDINNSRPNIQTGITMLDRSVNAYIETYYSENVTTQENTKEGRFGSIPVIPFVWVTGIVIMLVYAFASYLRIWKRVKESIGIQENIFICDSIETPFILGMVKPHIYLPSNVNDKQMSSVIAHEQAHLKRGDHLCKPMGYCLLAVYWFNPLCWLAYILLCRDIEMACDEMVIKDMDVEQKKTYSRVLLSFSVQGKLISACPLAFGEVGVKQRIHSVLNYKRPAFWIIVISIAAIIVTSVLFLTNPKGETAEVEEEMEDIVIASTGEEDTLKTEVEVTVPAIDLSATTGADGSTMYYADANKFIFGGYYGLFVYDVTKNQIIRSVDLAPIGCNSTQGDNACEILVTEDGSKVLLRPLSGNMMYVYSVNDNQMWMEPDNLEDYTLYHNEYTDVGNSVGKFASFEQDGNVRAYCLVNDTTIGELGYAIDVVSSYHLIFGDTNAIYNTDTNPPDANRIQNSMNSDGTPSRAYVEFLQEKISADMLAGKLPFVVCSAIMENPLRLEVAVLEMTEENINTIRSYETLGNAIEIVQGNAIQKYTESQSRMAPKVTKEDENMGVSYRETSIGHFVVDGDMVFMYKKVLSGQDPNTELETLFIVLTNDDEVTFEQVVKSYYSSEVVDLLSGTIIIGMKTIEL